MLKIKWYILIVTFLCGSCTSTITSHDEIVIELQKKGERISPSMYGIFFEEINHAGVSRGHYNMMLLAGIMEILSATIKEMRVGPSQSVYRNRLQTITSCVLSNQKVVNVVCNKSEDMVRYV